MRNSVKAKRGEKMPRCKKEEKKSKSKIEKSKKTAKKNEKPTKEPKKEKTKKEKVKIDYTIVNRVAISQLPLEVELPKLALHLNLDYEPEIFPGAIYHMKKPQMTIILYKNGKCVCTGLKDEKDIPEALVKFAKTIKKYEPKIKIPKKEEIKYSITNLVAHGKIDKNFDLFDLSLELDNVEYEPEIFPGAHIRINKPKLTFSIFRNGRFNCAGGKSTKDIEEGIKKLRKLLKLN